MKKYVLGLLTGLIISATVVYGAYYLYKAEEVSYTPSDNTWNVSNVDSAINELYDKVNTREFSETILWTNGSPNSTFNSQTVTLNDTIQNFKYLKINYKYNTSATDSTYVIVSVEEFLKYQNTSGKYQVGINTRNPNIQLSRAVYWSSDTKISFHNAYSMGYADYANSYLIPLSIIGLN